MRALARGGGHSVLRLQFRPQMALRRVGTDGLLPAHRWAEEKGLIPVEDEDG